MRIGAGSLALLSLALAKPVAAQSVPVPALEDPVARAQLASLVEEARQYLLRPEPFIVIPAVPTPAPCALDAHALELFAGIPDPNNPAVRRAQLIVSRQYGTSAEPPAIRELTLHFAQASCKDNRLDGPFDIVARYVISEAFGKGSRERHLQTRMQGVAHDGELVGTRRKASLTKPFRMLESNGKVTDLGQHVLWTVLAAGEGQPETTLSYLVSPFAPASFSTNVASREVGGIRTNTSYSGTQLRSIMHIRNGLVHGKFQIYTPGPNGVESTEGCYDNGELIKSVECNVD